MEREPNQYKEVTVILNNAQDVREMLKKDRKSVEEYYYQGGNFDQFDLLKKSIKTQVARFELTWERWYPNRVAKNPIVFAVHNGIAIFGYQKRRKRIN